jgi:hypothetical protein
MRTPPGARSRAFLAAATACLCLLSPALATAGDSPLTSPVTVTAGDSPLPSAPALAAAGDSPFTPPRQVASGTAATPPAGGVLPSGAPLSAVTDVTDATEVTDVTAGLVAGLAYRDRCEGPARSGAHPDFDGDGRADLAVAAPYRSVGGRARAGAVDVLYGMRTQRRYDQDTDGVPDTAETGDAFGSALAVGDFDGDGCADLAVGASEEHPGAGPRPPGDGTGMVHLFYGSPDGLRPGPVLDVRDFGRRPSGGDRFGAALAAGDLDGDGDDELVIGAPGFGMGGGVGVYGLAGRRPFLVTQRTGWVRQRAAATDQFGAAVAVGDFAGDGRAEIAVGAPGDSGTAGKKGHGSVTVLDVRRSRAAFITQGSPGIAGAVEHWDGFGAALATGDFNADGRADLAIGVPGEGLTPRQRAMDYGDGTIHVLYGSRGGLRTAGAEAWSQRTRGIKGTPRYSDRFGAALAAGDFNGDGDDELAVGVPGENAVQVFAGTRASGLARSGNVLIGLGRGGSAGGSPGDFGAALAAGRFTGGSADDLVVAAPGSGRLILLRGEVRKGTFTGLSAGRMRRLPHGPVGSLYGYALAGR